MAKDKKQKPQTLFWDEESSSDDFDTLVDLDDEGEENSDNQKKKERDTNFEASFVQQLDELDVPKRKEKQSPSAVERQLMSSQVQLRDLLTQPFSRTQSFELPDRYQFQGVLGVGGMGEVIRVHDRKLGRYVAMKIIRQDLAHHRQVLYRFIREAQISAQLEHPNIIPIHEIGELVDGRVYFSMKEVQGDTLENVLLDLHMNSRKAGRWDKTIDGVDFRGLIDMFHKVCEAIGYAHQHGVIHRDLKPENIMVGAFGEVLVMDWGIAKVLGDSEGAASDYFEELGVPVGRKKYQTRMGSVSGTPAYMAPEQARGEIDRLCAQTDVFSLGAILYEIFSGRAPRSGSVHQMLEQAQSADKISEPQATAPIPEELLEIFHKATAQKIEDRFPDAAALGQAIYDWLIGARKREQALDRVKKSEGVLSRLNKVRKKLQRASVALERVRRVTASFQPVEEKKELWKKEDECRELELEVQELEIEMLQLLRSALTFERDLPEAHSALAAYHHQRHLELSASDSPEAAQHLRLLEIHDRGEFSSYIKGDGFLTLHTNPVAHAKLFRFEEKGRKLVPVFQKDLGRTPFIRQKLPMGSYIVELSTAGHEKLQLPVYIPRGGKHLDREPKNKKKVSISLLRKGQIDSDECYVPAGWAWVGNRRWEDNQWRRVWVDEFIMQRFPVTNEVYLTYLNELLDEGEREKAIEAVPYYQSATQKDMVYTLKEIEQEDGSSKERFVIEPDAEGDLWELNWPVLLVSYYQAEAYAKWLSEKTGKSWRIPTDTEWEKSKRGVDGRIFTWGNCFEATWAALRDGKRGRPLPSSVYDYPEDESIYGVRGLCGNASDWCSIGQDEVAIWGGAAWSHSILYTGDFCMKQSKHFRAETTTIRLVRSL
ncbi:MAG: hypothetical protein CMK59_09915 [Proteobacteria bacterium]|nr:hypothetical protein [Pseudomonadota bacterium]